MRGDTLKLLATLAMLGVGDGLEENQAPRRSTVVEKKPVSYRWVKGRCVRVPAADIEDKR